MAKTKENAANAKKMPFHEEFLALSIEDKKHIQVFADVHAVSVQVFNMLSKEAQDYVMKCLTVKEK